MADRCPQLAASIAFHVVFSLFPLAIVVTGATSVVLSVTGSRSAVIGAIVAQLPLTVHGRGALLQVLPGATGGTAGFGVLGIVGLLWSAS